MGAVLFIRLGLVLCSLFLGYKPQEAVGAARFNYEITEHEAPAPPALNQSLLNYGYLEITGQHAAIPALAFGVYPLGVSLMHHGLPPILWQHGVVAVAGGPLNIHQACRMADDRQALGIDVNFRHMAAIVAMAAGAPLVGAAALAGLLPPAFAAYLNNALRGGGYFSDQAAAIYRLRHNPVPPNFLFMPLPGGGGALANCVVIHFHNTTRISKNLKELSHNASVAPGVGGAAYLSIKDIIDNQYAVAGLPAPSSSTVVSADFLQAE